MSYRNPNITYTDPLAFAKGFKSGFQEVEQMKDKEAAKRKLELKEKEAKERQKIADERYEKEFALKQEQISYKRELDREKERKQNELVESALYNKGDIGSIEAFDGKITSAFQGNINKYIDGSDYINASPNGKQEILSEINGAANIVKTKLPGILNLDINSFDKRNDPFFTQLKSDIAMDKDIKVSTGTSPLNTLIELSDGSKKTLKEINSIKLFDSTKDENTYEATVGKTLDDILAQEMSALRRNPETDISPILFNGKKAFTGALENREDILSWAFHNKISEEAVKKSEALGLNTYYDVNSFMDKGSAEIKRLKKEQNKIIIDDLFEQEIENKQDPYSIVPERPETLDTPDRALQNQNRKIEQAKQDYSIASDFVDKNIPEEFWNNLDTVKQKTKGSPKLSKDYFNPKLTNLLNSLNITVSRDANNPDLFYLSNDTGGTKPIGRGTDTYEVFKNIIKDLSIPKDFSLGQYQMIRRSSAKTMADKSRLDDIYGANIMQ